MALAVRLAAFAIGIGAGVHLRFGWAQLWSFLVALTVYAALGIFVETLLLGRLA